MNITVIPLPITPAHPRGMPAKSRFIWSSVGRRCKSAPGGVRYAFSE